MKHQLSWIGIAGLVVSLCGCPFRKQPPPVPQQGQAPTVQPEVPPPPAPTSVETHPLPPPQAIKLSEIAAKRNSARLDTPAKAALDEVAKGLEREPDSRAVIVGFAEPRELKSANLAAQRAASAKEYLAKEKGIDSSRIETRTSSTSGMKAETWIVPSGASFTEPDTEVVTVPVTKTPSPPHAPAAVPSQGQQTQSAATPAPPPTKTSKLIIQEGNPPNSPGPLAAGVGGNDSSSHAKQTTEQLLQAAQGNLNGINRPLSPDEQAMVAQIKDYMTQAHKATDDSDTVRAHNLALKAYLLSDELVKH